jgi:hypothetical protein
LEVIVKKTGTLVFMSALMLSLGWGCAANKTSVVSIPQARDKGPLSITITPREDMDDNDIKYLGDTLTGYFGEAGYDPVKIGKKRKNAGTELDITVERYEQSKSGMGCIVVSGGCTYICPCVAPCFLFPRYSTTRFNITTRVEAYRDGRSRFSERFSEIGQASSSLVEGTQPQGLKDVAINNTVARIMGRMNE